MILLINEFFKSVEHYPTFTFLIARYDFTGTLIVVPDVGSLQLPGAKAELSGRHKKGDSNFEGVRGLKALGVRDLNYKVAFLACSVISSDPRVTELFASSETY